MNVPSLSLKTEDRLSFSLVESMNDSDVVGVDITDSDGRVFSFEVSPVYLGPHSPALVLTSVEPKLDEPLDNDYWLLAGPIGVGSCVSIMPRSPVEHNEVVVNRLLVRRCLMPSVST